MFRSITNNTSKNLSAGGTISGDVTISGDLTVSGSATYTYDEAIAGKLLVGSTSDSVDSTLHVHKASAGSIASDSNTVLTVENSNHSLISILSPEAKDGAVMFGNPTDGALDGRLVYDNADRALQFWTAGTQRFTIDENGDVTITNSGSGKPKLTLYNSNTSGSQSGHLAFEQASTSQADDQQLGYISFGGYRDNDSSIETMVSMAAFMSDITTADSAGEFRLQVHIDNSASNVLNINGFDAV